MRQHREAFDDQAVAWIELKTPDQIRGSGSEPSQYNFGFVDAMGRLVNTHPTIGPALQKAFAQIIFAPGPLTRAEREMVAAVTAAAQDCHY